MLSQEIRTFCRRVLQRCNDTLKMETGVIARIAYGKYEVMAVLSQAQVFVEGDSYNFHNSICSELIKKNQTIAVRDSLSAPAMISHPLYLPQTMKAYLGTPISVDGTIWGILEFSSFTSRKQPFSTKEMCYIEWYAAELELSLMREMDKRN